MCVACAQGEHLSLPTPLVVQGISLMTGPRNLHLQERGNRRWRDGRKETDEYKKNDGI